MDIMSFGVIAHIALLPLLFLLKVFYLPQKLSRPVLLWIRNPIMWAFWVSRHGSYVILAFIFRMCFLCVSERFVFLGLDPLLSLYRYLFLFVVECTYNTVHM